MNNKVYINEARIKSAPYTLFFLFSYCLFGSLTLYLEKDKDLIWINTITIVSSLSYVLIYNLYIFLRIKHHVHFYGYPEEGYILENDLYNFHNSENLSLVLFILNHSNCLIYFSLSLINTAKTFPTFLDTNRNLFFRLFVFSNDYIFLFSVFILTLIFFIFICLVCCTAQEFLSDNTSQTLENTNQFILRHLQSANLPNYLTYYFTERLVGIRELQQTRTGGFCVICQSDERGVWRVLPCHEDHRFHTKCIDDWLGQGNACPICRIDPINDIPNLSEISEISGDANSPLPNSNRNGRIVPEEIFNESYDDITDSSASPDSTNST